MLECLTKELQVLHLSSAWTTEYLYAVAPLRSLLIPQVLVLPKNIYVGDRCHVSALYTARTRGHIQKQVSLRYVCISIHNDFHLYPSPLRAWTQCSKCEQKQRTGKTTAMSDWQSLHRLVPCYNKSEI